MADGRGGRGINQAKKVPAAHTASHTQDVLLLLNLHMDITL